MSKSESILILVWGFSAIFCIMFFLREIKRILRQTENEPDISYWSFFVVFLIIIATAPALLIAAIFIRLIKKIKKLLFILLFAPLFAAAQIETTFQTAHQSEFIVNSRTAFGGSNRVSVPVVIPNGTLRLIYSISVTRPAQPAAKPDLTALLSGGQLASTIFNQITQPFAGAQIDYYLTTDPNAPAAFNAERTFNAVETYENAHNIQNESACFGTTEKIYFLFRNMHVTQGSKVSLTVTAEVFKRVNPAENGVAVFYSLTPGWTLHYNCLTGAQIAEIKNAHYINVDCTSEGTKRLYLNNCTIYAVNHALGVKAKVSINLQPNDCKIYNLDHFIYF